jgi:glycosyltransferase involved in cell wall biosynthesis
MRLAFDHQAFMLQSYGGISRYFVRLVQGILSLGEQVDVLAPFHRNRYLNELPDKVVHGRRLDRFPPKSSRLIAMANRQISAMHLHKLQPDILHETYYSAKPVKGPVKGRILTVYDMIHEKFSDEFTANDPTSNNKRVAVSRADHIICISHSTKSDLCQMFDVPSEKVSVVHLGFDTFIDHRFVKMSSSTERPFLLYVGNRSGYKNFERMLKAVASCAKLASTFDVVAFGGGPLGADEHQLIATLGFRSNTVRQISGDDHVLGDLYRRATVLVYPSLYEGFGLPPIEAMAHDCPVVTSNTSSMPEIVGPAGEYFDPISIDAMSEGISKVVFNEQRRAQLITEGRSRLDQFSWRRCALETSEIYKHIMRSKELH